MVALPAALAVILPFWSTVAIALLLVFQVTPLLLALVGVTVTVLVAVSPTVNVVFGWLIVNLVTGIGASLILMTNLTNVFLLAPK